MTSPEAGWYLDPGGDGQRYWDGSVWTEHTHPGASSPSGDSYVPDGSHARPVPRLIRSPEDAELLASEWMRWMGFFDATCTRSGADGGLDVVSTAAVGQVKAHMIPVGRPELQQLYGVATSEHKTPLFFSLMSYTAQALEWADKVGMPLFRFDHAGALEAVNALGGQLIQGSGEAVRQVAGGPLGYPMRVLDAVAVGAARKQRAGRLIREQVAEVYVTSIWVQAVRLDCTSPGRRRSVRHHVEMRMFDLIAGQPFETPKQAPTSLDPSTLVMAPTVIPNAIVRKYTDAWKKLASVTQETAIARHRATLQGLGVPPGALSASPTIVDRVACPIVLALLQEKSGNRIVVFDGSSGALLGNLSKGMTANLPWAMEQVALAGRRLA